MLKASLNSLRAGSGVDQGRCPIRTSHFELLEGRILLSADPTGLGSSALAGTPSDEPAIHINLNPEQVIFHDDFDGVQLDMTRWKLPVWQSPTDGTYLGRTQLRVAQHAGPPEVSNDAVHLLIETYNPIPPGSGNSFYGQEIISQTTFSRGEGLAFETRARVVLPAPGGIVYAPFLYATIPGENTHDEIDFELLTNEIQSGANRIQTNVYDREPSGAGTPQFASIPGIDLTQYHTYRAEWLPDQVRWYADGTLIRTETVKVPDGPMPVYLNTWVPGPEWANAYDPALQPAASAAANQTFFFDVDYVTVSSLGTCPTVTINQSSQQVDPTGSSSIDFTVIFSEPVTGFAAGDVRLSGTAGATTAVVSGSGATYTVAVEGMSQSGTVIASVPAAVATDAAGNLNLASTSTDNTVTYNEPGAPVVFPDVNLKAAVEATLGLSNPTASDMAALVTLSANRRGIADLTGLETAINLTSLDLSDNVIKNVSPLSGLTNLSTLKLGVNDISDISPLSGLTDLSTLQLVNNQISDLSALSNLTGLTSLMVGFNPIGDFAPLSDLTKLSSLNLDSAGISNIAFLSSLTNLSDLSLSANEISDLSPLSSLTNLTKLSLAGTRSSDLSPLSGLTRLSHLHLPGNGISDVSPLSSLTNLSRLDLWTNQISDISGLADLIALDFLYLYDNRLNEEAYTVYLPQILANNPGIFLMCDPWPILSNTNVVSVPENSTATFQVRLSTQPAADVTVTISRVSGDSDIAVSSGSSLLFTPANWNTYQTVTLSAAADGDAANGTAMFRCRAPDMADKDVMATEQDRNVLSPVYRFWKASDNTHFYTIKEGEKQKLIDNYSHIYTYEGPAYSAFAVGQQPADTRPVYRFWKASDNTHFYTIEEGEKDKLIGDYSHIYAYEGPAFYAYTTAEHPIDTRPVYRFWKWQGNTHFYTIREGEKDKLINLFSYVFTFENAVWYAYTL